MTADTYTCPSCRMESHNPNDVVHQWCGACNTFGWETGGPPVYLNSVIALLQKRVRHFMTNGSPFSLQFEMFTGSGGGMKHRALIKVGHAVWKHSRREHGTPAEALLELVQSLENPHEQLDLTEPGLDRPG